MFRQFLMMACALCIAVAATASAQGAKPRTSFTGDLGYVSATGNTKLTTLSVGEKLGHTAGLWTLSQQMAFVYGETDAKVSANQLLVAVRADFGLDPRFSVFAGASYERNTFAGFNSRPVAITGLSWKAIVAPEDSMSVDAGGVVTRQSDVDGTSSSYPSTRVALAYRHRFSKAAYFQQLAEHVSNLRMSGSDLVNTETAFVAPVSAHVGIRLSYAVRYNSRPPVNFGSTDRVSMMGVQLSY